MPAETIFDLPVSAEINRPSQVSAAPLLSVLMPVFNERATVATIIHNVLSVPLDLELIVVDDGSTDGTSHILANVPCDSRLTVLTHAGNRGKGAAIQTALQHARGEFCVIQDADLEYDPRELPTLLEPLQAGAAVAVYGSRYLRSGHGCNGRWLRWGVWSLNQFIRWLYGTRLTDCATCYKCLPTELARSFELREPGFGFCAELTARLCAAGVRIVEVPISYQPRRQQDGKKLRLRDGWEAARILWRRRSNHLPLPAQGNRR